MAKVLLSYFDPFEGKKVNVSQQLAEAFLSSLQEQSHEIKGLLLPTVFSLAAQQLIAEIEDFKPDLVLALGEAESRDYIGLEKVALNWIDARIPDNQGNQPRDEVIVKGGPNAIFSSLPLRSWEDAIRQAGTPVAISYGAGTFVCNELMYQLLHYCQKSSIAAGFVHLPPLSKVSLQQQLLALNLMLKNLPAV